MKLTLQLKSWSSLVAAAGVLLLPVGCSASAPEVEEEVGTEAPKEVTPVAAGPPATVTTISKPTVTPPPTPEPMPTPTIEPSLAPESTTFGSRENPVPLGTVVDLGNGWHLRVISVTPNANKAIQAENPFNIPPKAGHQFFIARIEAKYTGRGSSHFDGYYRLRTVGSQAVAYSTFENPCGIIPDELPDPEVFTGGVINGNVCWEIRAGEGASLVMFDEPYPPSATRVFIALH
jgi:hypothetical protein